MIIIVHKNKPSNVFATHTDIQETEVLAAYSDVDFGVYRTADTVGPLDPVPEGTEEIRATPAA